MDIQFLGHSAFKVRIPGATLLIDPFLTGNPSFPEDMSVEQASEGVGHVLLTHGHYDHVGDTIDILKATGGTLTANFEICMWAKDQGIENVNPVEQGGCVNMGAFDVAMTNAVHSSSIASSPERNVMDIYLGNPAGVVVMAENEPTLLHMGDTDIFSDMALINEIYQLRSELCRLETASPWALVPRRWRASGSLSSRPSFHVTTVQCQFSIKALIIFLNAWEMMRFGWLN